MSAVRSRPRRAVPAKKSSPFSALEGAGLLSALVQRELRALQRPGTGKSMTATQRGTLMQRCSKMLVQLGEITGETLELPESKLVRLPQVRRLFTRVVEALAPWPEALAAVAAHLEAIERGDAPEGQKR